jgi:hypothetical protein
MSRFLKLSDFIINTKNINYIQSKPNQYIINMASNNINGSMIFGFGTINSSQYAITVINDNINNDYDIVTKWINDIEQNNN